jgi:thymidylate synthase ThyX
MVEFSETDKAILRRHVSNLDKNIYLIYNLPPEVVAVLFAYVSRSPNTFRENLLKLIKSGDIDLNAMDLSSCVDYEEAKRKAKEFHEKWVVGYGHASVAEHAVASIAIEDVSIVATKVIEDNRLASYTEKSTRYQVFDYSRYYKPKKIMQSEFAGLYEKTMRSLFDAYQEITPKMIEFMKEKYPKQEGMSDRLYENISKARACDVVRYILPAGTLTNLAMTANARTLEHAIRKFLSHPLDEVKEIGIKMKQEVTKLIPTLVKYVDENPYIKETNELMERIIKEKYRNVSVEPQENHVKLVDYDKDAENKLVSAIIYRYSHLPFDKIREMVEKMDQGEKEAIVDEYLKRMGRHDWPMRELEHIYYTFDILVDYGAYRDIQRHRMCTQTTQLLTTRYGFSMPPEIKEVGFSGLFEDCMNTAAEAYEEISKQFPYEAQYVVPLAYRKRVLFTWNLRELHHFIKLRSSRQGHISYRRIAHMIYNEIERIHPLFAKYIRVDKSEGPSR